VLIVFITVDDSFQHPSDKPNPSVSVSLSSGLLPTQKRDKPIPGCRLILLFCGSASLPKKALRTKV
jgi:hypothetical protein